MMTVLMLLEFMVLEELSELCFLTFFIRPSWMADAATTSRRIAGQYGISLEFRLLQ